MVSPPSRLATLAALVTVAVTSTHSCVSGTSLEKDAVTPLGDNAVIGHSSPVFSGRPADDMVQAVTLDDPTLSRAEIAAFGLDGPPAGDATVGDITNADIARLEAHFKEPMERGFKTINEQYKTGEAKTSPWPSFDWPTWLDGINMKWNGEDISAAEKYAAAFGFDAAQFMSNVSAASGVNSQSGFAKPCSASSDCDLTNDYDPLLCGRRTNQAEGLCVPMSYSISHGWAGAAVNEPEPRCSVDRGDITFHVFDIKALLSEVYDDAQVPIVFVGARSNATDVATPRDEYGRRTDATQRDLNPALLHIAVANVLGRFKQPFVVDMNSMKPVWNRAVRSYSILSSVVSSPAEAAQKFFNTAAYPFNSDAKYIADVRLGLNILTPILYDGPIVSSGQVESATYQQVLGYLLELDANQHIIGGEWLTVSQDDHPDFLWFPTAKPASDVVSRAGVSYAHVQELLQDSLACATPAPSPTTPSPQPTAGGSCGNDHTGPLACLAGDYCQPWNPSYYQCRRLDAKCGTQQVGVDFYGDDIAAVALLLPEQCCDMCHATSGCTAYTFVNYNPDGKAYCYLKKGTGKRMNKVGAVSSSIIGGICATPANGACGSNLLGASCCAAGQFCNPTVSAAYQCESSPMECGEQEVGVDYYGDDIAHFAGMSVAGCCSKCAQTVGCKAYTIVADMCYLKTGTGDRRKKTDAVSASVRNPLVATSNCATPAFGSCGDASTGAACCPDGSHCQIWDVTSYQCVATPAQCARQFTGVDFYGDDLAVRHNIVPSDCCAACAATPGCKAYTYVSSISARTSSCYLKSGTGDRRAHTAATSALLN